MGLQEDIPYKSVNYTILPMIACSFHAIFVISRPQTTSAVYSISRKSVKFGGQDLGRADRGSQLVLVSHRAFISANWRSDFSQSNGRSSHVAGSNSLRATVKRSPP